MLRRSLLLAATGALALAAYVAPGNGAATKFDPGVTATSVHIGATYPLSGAVGGVYGTVATATKAYYKFLFNGGGGQKLLHGRTLKVDYLDDQYDPSQTVTGTKTLVQQNKVFAIVGSLGTAPNLAIQKYLNNLKVPQVLIATGDSFWSQPCAKTDNTGAVTSNPKTCPDLKNKTGHYWTFGGLATYTGEAELQAKLLNTPKYAGTKLGVLYQNDAYGRPYLQALRKYLKQYGGKSTIQTAVPYDGSPTASTNMAQQVAQLKRGGGNGLYLIALPLQTSSALVQATTIGWTRKATFVNAVGVLPALEKGDAKTGTQINGIISSAVGPNPNDPTSKNLPAVVQYKKIMQQYYPKGDVTDVNNYAAMGGAWLFSQVLAKAGNPPTRAGLMNALTHLNISNDPYLFKGYHIHTTPTYRYLYPQGKSNVWVGGANGYLKPFGPLVGGLDN
jgi:branched-chain amino acid transport system substrate-binding protein